MPAEEIFDSCVRTRGDLAGVFEYDGEAGFFYLYETERGHGEKVLDSIHIFSGQPDLAEHDVSVRWDLAEEKVGLFIRDVLWAVFDGAKRAKYGGRYETGAKQSLPSAATIGFGAAS
jgi:hypothetical protein